MATHFIRDIPLRVLHRRVGDEHVTLLQACYDNPLFEEDAKAAAYQGGTSPRTHTANHADPPRAKDYLHARPPQPHEVQFKSPKTRRRRQLWILAFLFTLIAVIALIIGLLVHFLGKCSSSFV